MIISAPHGLDKKRAFKIVGRDGRNHKSPNSGYPESAAAGLLSVQLGGSNSYNGKMVHKPTIGDPGETLKKTHIEDSIRLMFGAELLLVFIFVVVKLF
jgi:adenosylcobinamide-phosphate synthase